jgi:hypothetical protein
MGALDPPSLLPVTGSGAMQWLSLTAAVVNVGG